ncbi:MAG: thiol peroxidase [Erysipelotrichaceae bacterium]
MQVKFGDSTVRLLGYQLKKDDFAPMFRVTGKTLEDFDFSLTYGVRILLSFPSVDTDVCDLELSTFNDAIKEFPQIKVFAISNDLPFAQTRWCQLRDAQTIKVYSDYKLGEFASKYGVKMVENGLLCRAVFVVDSNDRLVYVSYLPQVGDQPDFKAVLDAAKLAK